MASSDDRFLQEGYKDLYENAPCGLISLLSDGKVYSANLTISHWLGFSAAELRGKHLHDFLTIPGRIFYETHFAPLLVMQGFFDEVALDLLTREGKRLPVLINAAQGRDTKNEVIVTRISVFRATERRRYERELVVARQVATKAQEELRTLNEQLESRILDAVAERLKAEKGLFAEKEISDLREQFIAVLGHDLRNPLAALLSGIRFLRKDALTERQNQIADLMQGSINRMSRLIDDLMDFASAKMGLGLQITLKTTTDLQPILDQVIGELRTTYPDRLIDASFTDSGGMHIDSGRIGQMVSNLVANALVHGDESQPVKATSSIENGELVLRVANAGTPIPLEIQQKLFQPFFRGDKSSAPKGLGLGLYISSEICRVHGGSLSVESSKKETCFTCRIPVKI